MTGPATQLPEEAELPTPLAPANLARLFFRPSLFFRDRLSWDEAPELPIAIYLTGIAGASGRIDRWLLRQDLSRSVPGVVDGIVESWALYWLVVGGLALLYGAFRWWVGGWWYRVRLDWCDAVRPDPRVARLVYTYSALVQSFPAFGYLLVATLVFPNYYEAWTSEELWSAALIVFPFWAVFASYRGVITRFQVKRSLAAVWFLVTPWLLLLIAFGVLAFLYAAFAPR